jgi:hypothetical protein
MEGCCEMGPRLGGRYELATVLSAGAMATVTDRNPLTSSDRGELYRGSAALSATAHSLGASLSADCGLMVHNAQLNPHQEDTLHALLP